MSTDHITMKKITFADLFDGRLERFGVREHIRTDTTSDKARCLTDGRNYVWTFADADGLLACLTRYAPGGAPGKILSAIAEAFDTDIISEHEPQFWGFDTQEEWDVAMDELEKKYRARQHANILKFIKGEPNDIEPGTVGMIEANIAKKLVAEDPRLISPDKQAELMEAIDNIYDRDHAVVIKLSDTDMAAAIMSVTHEDNLPQV